ncbi:hypothetical protein M408DRAFT_171114 [Serendipita vermifera MAFF 305830]|uniref:DUF6535 domain-containing protein n=1 Tax=Serendipita vermifera MAFF 305830 TaxID=933852 RepID=A0A0C2WLN5_SERVB|nr:hypothetical protein M408DRAFT_171114 [Serendipita vermifera MAFF 305830]
MASERQIIGGILDLEKGKPRDVPNQQKTPPTEEKSHPSLRKQKALEAQADSPFSSHCREDAPIWAQYLEESEIEDKELAFIWNSSLDSLLVFAGLFAAILTAFLIESSKDLKEDPQEHLLTEILGTLRNVPNTNPFEPERSSLHVNGLWFTSLTLTLISALGGVLAKGWLAKYNPASRQAHANQACERHLRANRAREWQLAPLITGVPLLIQISLFLFFAGLIIQISDRPIRIWSTIVPLVGLAMVLYIFGTILPWISPACPFHTPISDFLPGVAAQSQYRDTTIAFQGPERGGGSWKSRIVTYLKTTRHYLEDIRRKPEKLEMQAQILSWVITNSTSGATIDEAIKAIAGSEPTKELQKALLEAGARETLHTRLQYSVKLAPGLPKLTINRPQLEPLLCALLQIERSLSVDTGIVDTLPYTSLLDDGQCLHRWDDFEPYLQRLAFSLRVHALVNCGRDDHDENWTLTVENLNRMTEEGSPPHIRRHLFFAALRGFLKGHKLLRRTCELVLSKQLFHADLRKEICAPGGFLDQNNGELSVSIILNEISERIAQLCGDDDPGSREIGSQMLLRCAKHGYATWPQGHFRN